MGAGLGVRSILPTVREGALFREEQKIFAFAHSYSIAPNLLFLQLDFKTTGTITPA